MNRMVLVFLGCLISTLSWAQRTQKVLVVAGGHRFDTVAFVAMFSQMKSFDIDTAMQPGANELLASQRARHYDAVVFYDSWKTISDAHKEAYRLMLKKGVGMVFLHHSLVSYQQWPYFTQIIGGKYKKPRFVGDSVDISGYKHDIQLSVHVSNPKHPVTKGMIDFELHDEGYTNIDVLPTVTPLLTTDHPYCNSTIGWYHKVQKSRIVYLLPGHDANAFHNQNYRRLVENAIGWVAH